MNRDLLKRAIKKIVLQEITNNQLGTPVHTDVPDEKGKKALSKEMGKEADVKHVHGTGKTAGVTEKQAVQLSKAGENFYDVVSVTEGSERKIARGISLDDAIELVKKHANSSEKTYVQKAADKSVRGNGIAPKKDEEKNVGTKADDTDEMKDSKEETQMGVADDSTAKADEKVDEDLAPIDDDVAPQLGGELVDKIEKIIDRVLKSKNKAEPKTAYLKADASKESPDKLSTKLKDTAKIKGTETPIGKPSPQKK